MLLYDFVRTTQSSLALFIKVFTEFVTLKKAQVKIQTNIPETLNPIQILQFLLETLNPTQIYKPLRQKFMLIIWTDATKCHLRIKSISCNSFLFKFISKL